MVNPDGGPSRPYKFNDDARRRFLEHLAETGRFYDSARAAGVNYTTMNSYRAGQQNEDLEFEEQVQEALHSYRDILTKETHRRAVEGWEERPVISKEGSVVGYVYKYDSQLLLALLKKHDPEFRERFQVDSTTELKGSLRTKHEVDLKSALKRLSKEGRGVLKELVPEE